MQRRRTNMSDGKSVKEETQQSLVENEVKEHDLPWHMHDVYKDAYDYHAHKQAHVTQVF